MWWWTHKLCQPLARGDGNILRYRTVPPFKYQLLTKTLQNPTFDLTNNRSKIRWNFSSMISLALKESQAWILQQIWAGIILICSIRSRLCLYAHLTMPPVMSESTVSPRLPRAYCRNVDKSSEWAEERQARLTIELATYIYLNYILQDWDSVLKSMMANPDRADITKSGAAAPLSYIDPIFMGEV